MTKTNILDLVETASNGLGVVLGISIADIQLVLGLIITIINLVFLLTRSVISLVKWFKKASADGKITTEELDEATKIIDDTVKGIEEQTKKDDEPKK